MKKIAIWNNYTFFAHNQAFNPKAYSIGEDISYPIILLKEKLEEQGYQVETLDMDVPESYNMIIFLDCPDPRTCCCDTTQIPKEKKILLLTECEMIYKPNGDVTKHKGYNKVFTYNDELVKNYGYIKLNIPNKIKPIKCSNFSGKKLCTMIVGNKMIHDKGELYSARLETLSFFEREHPDEFDLYGIGWDKRFFFGPKIVRGLNRINWLRKTFAKKHKCYRGPIDSKISTLSQYKFAVCYENTKLIPGYITEKIWDCFFAGCVPIYWGAPNITEYIPKEAFIDRRSFPSNQALYDYISGMSEYEYQEYISVIRNTLEGETAYHFSAESYVDTIIRNIL